MSGQPYDVALGVLGEPADEPVFGTPVGPEALAELGALVEDSTAEVFDPNTATFTKLSNFWATSSEPLDLRPQEPEIDYGPSFVEDLQALISEAQLGSPSSDDVRVLFVESDEWSPKTITQLADTEPRDIERFDIPPAPTPSTKGGGMVSELFNPITSVSAPGMSTAPPQKRSGESSADGSELQHPDDEACLYLGDAAPSYYFVHGDTVVTPPFRNSFPVCHHPLYFEDPNLERCGVSNGKFTTVRSTALFGAQVLALPYQLVRTHPKTHVKALPDCQTCQKFGKDAYIKQPTSKKALLAELGVITGLIFLIP